MTHEPGFIALITVVIFAAVALMVSVSTVAFSIDQVQATVADELAARAHAAATFCAEEALMKLKASLSYGGNETFSVGQDTCRVLAVGGVGNTNRTVQVTSTVMEIHRKIDIFVPKVRRTLEVSRWRDVQNF